MADLIYPVLLCGGAGTRLWPLSRKSFPKQFVSLIDDLSLFQASALRLTGDLFAPLTVVTGVDYRFIALEQLSALNLLPSALLTEPEGRNTAAAICAAALSIDRQQPGALMIVAPADHVIPDKELLTGSIQAASTAAREGQLITFGIHPDKPETGYGWLELSQSTACLDQKPHHLRSFTEKPDITTAERLLALQTYLWNAGLFLFSTTSILQALERHLPDTLALVRQAYKEGRKDLAFTHLAPEPWSLLESISIDHAVMEKAENISVIPFPGHWSDIGDWQAVWKQGKVDSNGVVTSGEATAIACNNSFLKSASEGLQVVGLGLQDIMVIAMSDAVLVADKSRAQEVKKVVEVLKSQDVKQAEVMPRDYRPWGWYEHLVSGDFFRVRRVVIHPGAAMSKHSHRHRSEHWVVVEGEAEALIDSRGSRIMKNESAFIPPGIKHQVKNRGEEQLTIIEIQTGTYLGDDDITRYYD